MSEKHMDTNGNIMEMMSTCLPIDNAAEVTAGRAAHVKPRDTQQNGNHHRDIVAQDVEPSEGHDCLPSAQYDAVLEHRDQLANDIATHHTSAWEALLAEVESAATASFDLLQQEADELSQRRYGADHLHFCCEPPAISRLSNLSTRSPNEQMVQTKIQSILDQLMQLRDHVLEDLKEFKRQGHLGEVQRLGNLLADVRHEHFKTKNLDAPVVRRSKVSWERLAAYNNRCELRNHVQDRYNVLTEGLTADARGYTRILDFYRYTDSRVYSFGRQGKVCLKQAHPGGGLPWLQRFADTRSNVTILSATDTSGALIYCDFSVSGKGTPGVVDPVFDRSTGPLHAQACEEYRTDGKEGKEYSREYDAEFKVAWHFVQSMGLQHQCGGGHVEIWTKKAPCASCSDVIRRQLPLLMPQFKVHITVHDSYGDGLCVR